MNLKQMLFVLLTDLSLIYLVLTIIKKQREEYGDMGVVPFLVCFLCSMSIVGLSILLFISALDVLK